MYCPVDGDEFVEGITRCPEHDVDLVAEDPLGDDWDDDTPTISPWFERDTTMRAMFVVLVVAAVLYALAGVTTSGFYVLEGLQGSEVGAEISLVIVWVQNSAFALALGSLGVLGGSLIIRTYARLGEPRTQEEIVGPTPVAGTVVLNVLFAVAVASVVVWVFTIVATTRERVQYETQQFPIAGETPEPPGDAFLDLLAANTIAYAAGTGSLVLMGGLLMVRAHGRIRPAAREEDELQP